MGHLKKSNMEEDCDVLVYVSRYAYGDTSEITKEESKKITQHTEKSHKELQDIALSPRSF